MRFARTPRSAVAGAGAFVAAVCAVVAVAGCGGSSSAGQHTASGNRVGPVGPGGAALARACSTAVAPARELTTPTSFVHVGGAPFGVAATPDGRWLFVDDPGGGGVGVMSATGSVPRLVRTIRVPGSAVGMRLTADGRYLLVADGRVGATVISVSRAEQGSAGAVLGTLTDPRVRGGGAIEAIASPDGRYAFVSVEAPGLIAVYDLARALADGFRRSSYVGSIRLGEAVVGTAVSPNGRWLYATSELARGTGAPRIGGTISVIDLARAEHDPSLQAVVATAPAHCSPVRVAVSPDGRTVWVTARESDQLLAFSAARLLTDPAHALLAAVRVGEAPVGLALVDGGGMIVVADSNRFGAHGQRASLTVVNAAAALDRRAAVVGTLPAGAFPREMALEPNGRTLIVGNFGSGQLETVAVDRLPATAP